MGDEHVPVHALFRHFTDDYEGENLWVDVILYSQQFEDEEGNIYPVEEEVVSYSECSHVYHVGIYKNHGHDTHKQYRQ